MANGEGREADHLGCHRIGVFLSCACIFVELHSPPVRCMVAQASCAVGGTITVTTNYCCSASYASCILLTTKNKAAGINLHLIHPRHYMLRQFLLSVRASVFIHEPSHTALARGTFESIVVTYNCTNALYYYRTYSSGAPS